MTCCFLTASAPFTIENARVIAAFVLRSSFVSSSRRLLLSATLCAATAPAKAPARAPIRDVVNAELPNSLAFSHVNQLTHHCQAASKRANTASSIGCVTDPYVNRALMAASSERAAAIVSAGTEER